MVTLTTDNGGTFDNVFAGTRWDDDAAPGGVPTATDTPTALTRAFSGRLARGIRNRFMDEHPDAPLAYPENLVNDLEPAALSLRPEISGALEALREAGAARALVTGSGPTAFGLFPTPEAAADAAGPIRDRFPGAIATAPLST